jgi:cell wall-associated NlpC family hydrolase
MRPTSSRLLLLLLGATLAFAACTPHRETVNRYKYLIKESDSENTATSTTPSNKEIIREKAASLNIGEKLVPVLEEASEYLGTPYTSMAATRTRGSIALVLRKIAIQKRVSTCQGARPIKVSTAKKSARKNLQIGDLVFFDAKSSGKIDHVGMVTKVEGDKVVFIHSSTSKGVRFDMLNEGYWQDKLRESRRVPLQ